MQRFLSLAIITVLLFLVDLYVFQAVKTAFQHLAPATRRVIHFAYWSVFALTTGTTILAMLTRGTAPGYGKTHLASILFIIFASKLVVMLFLAFEDVVRIGKVAINAIASEDKFDPSRQKFLSQLGLVVAALPLSAFVYGMVRGAYNYQVKKITLKFPNLPKAFHGFRMLQISDLHVGSFASQDPLRKVVGLINEQEADVIVFTGDLVNNVASELTDHVETLRQLRAKEGVLSVLGNHDYGDYVNWENRAAKNQNLDRLKAMQAEMGWKLLLNEHHLLERGGEKIAVLGVENWGARGFSRYGRLDHAYNGTQHIPFKVLLSHDPSHWDAETNRQYPDIDLTLSGHTHGMQFGVDIPGFKWSPAQYVYAQWAGLYEKGRQKIYVNPGLGFHGYTGRVGILPEITVFEFQQAES